MGSIICFDHGHDGSAVPDHLDRPSASQRLPQFLTIWTGHQPASVYRDTGAVVYG